MARPPAWQSFYQDLPLNGKDEFTGAAPKAFTNDNSTFSYTSAISRISTPALAPPFASAELVAKYINANLQKATKLALKLFIQGQQ